MERYDEMWVGDGVIVELVGDVRERERGDTKKMLFGGATAS